MASTEDLCPAGIQARSFAISMFTSEQRIEEFHLNCIQPKSSLSQPNKTAIGFFSAVIFFFVFFCFPSVAGYKSHQGQERSQPRRYTFHQRQGAIMIAVRSLRNQGKDQDRF